MVYGNNGAEPKGADRPLLGGCHQLTTRLIRDLGTGAHRSPDLPHSAQRHRPVPAGVPSSVANTLVAISHPEQAWSGGGASAQQPGGWSPVLRRQGHQWSG
jgi:hypothetical protein